MAKSKKNVRIEEKPEAPVSDVGIVSILETNYMPYAMSVIVSRAIRRSTASSPRTASCCIRCIKWG